MPEEKKSRSKRTSSKTNHTKDADAGNSSQRGQEKQVDNCGKKHVIDNEEKISVDDGKIQRRSKKRRRNEDDGEGTPVLLNGEHIESDVHKKKKKKRVSFAAGSEATDAQNDSDGDEEDKAQSPGPEEKAGQADGEVGDASKKAKKRKKKEGKKKSGDSTKHSTNTESAMEHNSGESPILSYLDLYHKDRPAWKFQKIRETQLFKHILSLEHIPVRYNAALLSYLQGLRGEAAKGRLREVAQTAIQTDTEETKPNAIIENPEPSDGQAMLPYADYRKAVYVFRTRLTEWKSTEDPGESYEQLDAELKERFLKRQRAEIIVYAIDGKVFTMSNLKAPPQKGKNATLNQPGKKKKNRTAFVEISSSSESSDDSDSDSDKAHGHKKENNETRSQPVKKKKKKKNRTAVVEVSSSSESDSNSSS
ncbi:WKF domain-containing protein [Aspergillus lucknowensis]|uniref:WKF domain-containing protein n=1 Tax=Aspergillus lucknowensis TaxID=176173 RepID=A0ABR4LUF0_9EURO